MSGPTLIIKQQKSPYWYLFWAAIAAGLLLLSFYFGQFLVNKEHQETIEKVVWLEQQLAEYQQAFKKANEDLVMQAQSARVDNQSSQQLIGTIKQLQDSQRQLEEELTFYRNIMAPELAENGLTIADFEVDNTSSNKSASFKLVLTQAGKQEQFLKGDVELKLHGQLNGETVAFEFRELGTFQAKHFQFQFRYFQNIEGEIVLPVGFIAEHVSILAKTKGLRKNQIREKQFDWNI